MRQFWTFTNLANLPLDIHIRTWTKDHSTHNDHLHCYCYSASANYGLQLYSKPGAHDGSSNFQDHRTANDNQRFDIYNGINFDKNGYILHHSHW